MAYRIDDDNRRDVLTRGFGVLTTLDFCREKTGTKRLGKDAEEAIVRAVLHDLESVMTIGDVDKRVAEKLSAADAELQRIKKESGQ